MTEPASSEISIAPKTEVSLADAQRFNRVRERLNSFAPTEMFGAKIKIKEGKGMTLVQRETIKKEKPPEVTEPPVAPPTEVTPPLEEGEIPAAPPQVKSVEPPPFPPPGPEPPQKFTVGLASVKAGEGKEVVEAEAKLAAKQKEQEERGQWKWTKKDLFIVPVVARGLRRFWFNTVGQAAMYSKDKSQAVDMMAEAGLQYRSLPKEFQKEVDEVVYSQLMERNFGRRVWWAGSNIFHRLTWTTTEQEAHRNNFLRRLRTAVIEIGEKNPSDYTKETQDIVSKHGSLLESYKRVLTGDYRARQAMIDRLVDDVGGSMIDAAAGEKKTVLNLKEADDPLRKFLVDEVMKPLLKEGFSPAGISEKTRLQMMVKLDEFMTSREFVDWWDKNAKEFMETSLSFGNNLIAAVEEKLLPQLKAAWSQQEFVDRHEEYLKNLSLELSLGTLMRAQKEEMPETRLERLVSKQVDRKKVLDEYLKLKDNAPSLVSTSSDTTAASVNRANLIRNLGARGRGRAFTAGISEAYWTAPIVAGVSLAQLGAKGIAGAVVPVVGGAAVYGALRGWQEASLFDSNLAMHRIEKTLNHQFTPDARLRREMDKLLLQQRAMADYNRGMNESVRKIESGEAVDGNLKELFGYLSDIEARRQIQIEKKLTLFQASSPDTQIQEQENTAMRKAAALAKEKIAQYFAGHPGKFTQIVLELGFNQGVSLDQIIGGGGELTANFKENILTGVDVDRLGRLGSQFRLEKKVSISALEGQAARSKLWKGVSIGALSATGAAGGFLASRWALNQAAEAVAGWQTTVGLPDMTSITEKSLTDGSLVDIVGRKVKLPAGYIYDSATAKIIHQASSQVVDNKDIMAFPGPQISHEILSSPVGPPVEKTLVIGGRTIKTLVPDGGDWDPLWRQEAGKTNVWDLVALKKDGSVVPLINDAEFDPSTGKMLSFDQTGSKISKSAIEAFQKEFGLAERKPDTGWIKKLLDLRDQKPGQSLRYGDYNFSLDGSNHLQINDLNGKEVAHNLIDFNPATKEFTYKALPVNPIPEKLVAALQSAGFIVKKEEVYQNIHLVDIQGVETNLERIPEKVLKQIYDENKGQVQQFTDDNLHWLAHGAWAKPAGEVVKFDSSEAINLPFEGWKPFRMTEVVDGKRVFSLADFLNWWEKAEVINENQVRILTGPEAGKIFDINPEPGRLSISQQWLKEVAQSHQTVLFDRLNKMASNAPKGFLDDLTAFKEGYGDPSRFALEARFDPLSTKGVVQQFSGNSIWNAYADPSQVPGVFKDNLFMNERGDFRAWIHFIWTPNAGDYSEVYSLANSGPAEWVKMTLGNPVTELGKTPQLQFSESVLEKIPTYGLKITRAGMKVEIPGLPWLFVRRPLEAPERSQAPRPTVQPIPPLTSRPLTPSTKTPTVQPTPSVKEGSEEQRKQEYFQLRERLLSDIEKVKKGEKTKEKFKEDWGDEYNIVVQNPPQHLQNQVINHELADYFAETLNTTVDEAKAVLSAEERRLLTETEQKLQGKSEVVTEIQQKLEAIPEGERAGRLEEVINEVFKSHQIDLTFAQFQRANEIGGTKLQPEAEKRLKKKIDKRKEETASQINIWEAEATVSTPKEEKRELIPINLKESLISQAKKSLEQKGYFATEGDDKLLEKVMTEFLVSADSRIKSVETGYKSISGNEAKYEAKLHLPLFQSADVQFSLIYDPDEKKLRFKYPPVIKGSSNPVNEALEGWKKKLEDKQFNLLAELKEGLKKRGLTIVDISVEIKDGKLRVEMKKV